MKGKKIYLVYSDDCNENDCGCHSDSVEYVYENENDAIEKAKELYHGFVTEMIIR